MTKHDDAREGIQLSSSLIRAVAERDQPRLLQLINESEIGPLRWACARLTSMVWESTVLAAGGDEGRASMALFAASFDSIDSLVTRAELWANDSRLGDQA